jgi:hypothetical protein
MTRIPSSMIVIGAVMLALLGGKAISAQDKYTLKVPIRRLAGCCHQSERQGGRCDPR